MTLIMSETEVFPRLTTESESLTFSDSCVKSDIANIIKKIYSPRPLMHYNKAVDSAVEARDVIGDNVAISRPKEKEVKRFGFHFESASRNFAKTIVDSSTTSGSVSMPIVKYKPKRLRRVCECCKRKIPFRDHETRVKRACTDCMMYRLNDGSDVENGSTCAGRGDEENRAALGSKVKVSNFDFIQIHPASSFKLVEANQAASTNLERKRSCSNLRSNCSGNTLKRNKTQVLLNCSSVLNLHVIPDIAAEKKLNKAPEAVARRVEEARVRNVSFLQQIVSNFFGKNKPKNAPKEGARSSHRKTEKFRNVRKKSSKTDLGVKKRVKNQKNINENLTKNLEQDKPPLFNRSTKRKVASQQFPINEIDKGPFTNLEGHHVNGQTIISDETIDIDNVMVHSCPELTNIISKCKDGIKTSVEDENRQDALTCDKDVEIGLGVKDERKDHCEKHGKYQVAYKSLRIEKDADWSYEFWGRIFGVCHSVVSFFTAFFLHFLTFVLQSVIQPLCFGTVRIASDHFFKPCLSTAFESVIQPSATLVERFALSLRDMCFPVSQCFGEYCKEVSHVCKACRVVEINKNYHFGEESIKP